MDPYRIKFLPPENGGDNKLHKAHDVIDTYHVVDNFVKSKEKRKGAHDHKLAIFWILVVLTVSPIVTLIEFLIARAIYLKFP